VSVFLGLAIETEGRRGPQPRLPEGSRYLNTPEYRPHGDQPKLSPFFVSHFRGALQIVRSNSN
jgi:hypothetical protein